MSAALHECVTLDCERAHAHLSALSPTSSLRQGDVFRAIEYRYHADRLLQADIEPDLAKRRTLYQAIADSPTVDSMLKLVVAARIARLGGQLGDAKEVQLNATAVAIAAETAAAADLLAKSRSKVPADQNEVRAKLEPKIFAGKATREDVAMLRTVCKAQRDAACLRQLDHLILP